MDIKVELKNEIEEVNEALNGYLDNGVDTKLYKAIRHYPKAGGKRLRPVMALLVANAISGDGARTLPFGTALEITHNFTLIHDDLMDNDEMRRDVVTVHKLFDTHTAINAGDVMLAMAFEALAGLECDDSIYRVLAHDLAKTVRLIGEGQQMDMDFGNRLDVTEAEALKMIELKTAVFFETACKGGALIAGGTDEQVEAMRLFGLNLGIGFQVADDLLDLMRETEKIGKPSMSDLREGKKTVIVTNALSNAGTGEREMILSTIGNPDSTTDDLKGIRKVLVDIGAVDHSRAMAKEYIDNAKGHLNVLPDSREKDLLLRLADFMYTRGM